jgi:hypothetical protein
MTNSRNKKSSSADYEESASYRSPRNQSGSNDMRGNLMQSIRNASITQLRKVDDSTGYRQQGNHRSGPSGEGSMSTTPRAGPNGSRNVGRGGSQNDMQSALTGALMSRRGHLQESPTGQYSTDNW